MQIEMGNRHHDGSPSSYNMEKFRYTILSFQSRICNRWLPFGLWQSPAGLKVAVTARRGICVASPDCQRPWQCYSHGMTASGSLCCCHLLCSSAPGGLLSWPSSSEDGHSRHSDRDTSGRWLVVYYQSWLFTSASVMTAVPVLS